MYQTKSPAIVPGSKADWPAALGGGLIYGIAFSIPFAFFTIMAIWRSLGPAIERVLGLSEDGAGIVILGALILLLALGGGLFGRLLGATKTGAPALPVATVAGVALAIGGETVRGLQPWQTFALAFPVMAALVLLGFMSAVGWVLKLPRPVRLALPGALATWAAYLLVIAALDPIPGFHVGGGNAAMVKVAAIGHVVAGTVGAAVSLVRFRKARQAGT